MTERDKMVWAGDIASPDGARLVRGGIKVKPTDALGGGYLVYLPHNAHPYFVLTAEEARQSAERVAEWMQERAYEIDFERMYLEAIPWSDQTFGPGRRTEGICKHIEKELAEIRSAPDDPKEWIDVAILGLDGAWRCLKHNHPDYSPTKLAKAVMGLLCAKYLKNRSRTWGKIAPEDQPMEHDRSRDTSTG